MCETSGLIRFQLFLARYKKPLYAAWYCKHLFLIILFFNVGFNVGLLIKNRKRLRHRAISPAHWHSKLNGWTPVASKANMIDYNNWVWYSGQIYSMQMHIQFLTWRGQVEEYNSSYSLDRLQTDDSDRNKRFIFNAVRIAS